MDEALSPPQSQLEASRVKKDAWESSSFSGLCTRRLGSREGTGCENSCPAVPVLVSAEHLCRVLDLKGREQSLELLQGQGPAMPEGGCAIALSVQMFGHKCFENSKSKPKQSFLEMSW